MLTEYIQSALNKAKYEIIDDDNPYYGEVSLLKGVWAQGRTLEECRKNLKEVVEGWIILHLEKGLPVPSIGKYKIEKPPKILKRAAYA